jgi:gamma-glutamyltranspeptidase / glutathione hydrolase
MMIHVQLRTITARCSRMALLSVTAFCAATGTFAAEPKSGPGPYEHAVVAADHPLASRVGAEILQSGGNVVDAAVGVSFALSVLRPEGCGVGGGGFMLIWDAGHQRATAIDYRERAPAAATHDMYQNTDGKLDPELSRHGGLAVAVPGNVFGLCSALVLHGSMSLHDVLQPVVRLAEDGFPVDEQMHNTQLSVLQDFARHEGYADRFALLSELYLGNGKALEVGERFHSPLAGVLRKIADGGPDAYYKGPVAEAISAEVQRQGGILTRKDLQETDVTLRHPLRAQFDGYEVLEMPPPSSGGVAIVEMLNALTEYDRNQTTPALADLPQNSPAYVQLLAELMKHAFADRAAYLGDTDFADVPIERLTSVEYARKLAARIDLDHTHPPEYYGGQGLPDDAGTSHFSIIDAEGNAVACTETINTLYGSYVVVPEFGIILNNEMDDFTALPGQPNAFGLIQSEANAVAAGKKPLSSMSPTILVRDGKAVYAAGASGGPRIINGTFQVLLNMVCHDQLPQQAVATPRIHHQWQPNTLFLEEPLLPVLRQPLEQRGHEIAVRDSVGTTQAVSRTATGLYGGSDPRKGGIPAGY